MRVDVARWPTWVATASTTLFEGRYGGAANFTGRTYDLSPDGRWFLMIKRVGTADPTGAPANLVRRPALGRRADAARAGEPLSRFHVPIVRSVRLPAFAEGFGEARRSAVRARSRQPDRTGSA